MISPMQLVTLWHEYKKTIKLSLPLIVSNLSHVLYGIIDSVMVGSLGVVPLAASAFINGVIAIPTVFLVGLSSAFSVLVAQSLGRRAYSDCGSYLTNSFWFAQTLTVVILAGLFFMQPLLNHFGQAPDVVTAGMEYYLYMAVSLLFLTATAVFRKYSEGLSYTLAPTVFYTVGILLNVFLIGSLFSATLEHRLWDWLGQDLGRFLRADLLPLALESIFIGPTTLKKPGSAYI